MAKQKPPEEPAGDVPLWFMTYSDVITLMMTFFILLLTFATNEPERFEQMKVSVFGSSGANGLVGNRPDGIEKDSWTHRVRPRASRLTATGSETPPTQYEAATSSMDGGLESLQQSAPKIVDSISIVIPGQALASMDGKLYDYGEHNLKMLANMMHSRTYELTVEVSADSQINRALACIQYLFHIEGVDAERLSVSNDRFSGVADDQLRMRLTNFNGVNGRGEERAETAK